MAKKSKEPPRTTRACSAGQCKEPGEFRAPKSRWEIGEYQFLCLDHIREFNQAWDYFEGWSGAQIEEFRDGIAHGHRPTWNMTSRIGVGPQFSTEKLRDSFFRMLGEEPPKKSSKEQRRIKPKERAALATLDLEPGVGLADVKSRYKKLVKQHHPDVNKGDKKSEETFKRITLAYAVLLKLYETSHEE